MPTNDLENNGSHADQPGSPWNKQDQSRMLRSLAIMGGLSLLIFARFFLSRRIFRFTDIGADTIDIEWPYWRFLARSIQQLEFPSWTFASGLGQNIYWSGAFEPFTLLMTIFGQENVSVMIGFAFSLKVTLCAWGAWLFCYKMTRNMAIALLGGLCWAYSSQVLTIGTWCYYFSTMAMILPFFLLAIDQSLAHKRHLALIATSAGLVFCGAFHLWYFALVFIFYGLLRIILIDQPWRVKILRALITGSASLLGVGLTAFLILPDLQVMLTSARSVTETHTPWLTTILSSLTAAAVAKEPAAEYFCSFFMSECLGSAAGYHGYHYNILEAPHLFVGTVTAFFFMVAWCFEGLKGKFLFSLTLLGIVLMGLYPGPRLLVNGFVAPYWRQSTSIVSFVIIVGAMRGLWHWYQGRRVSHWQISLAILSTLVGFWFAFKIANISADLNKTAYWICGEFAVCAITLQLGRMMPQRRSALLIFITLFGIIDILVQSVIPLHSSRRFYQLTPRKPSESQILHDEFATITKAISIRAQNYPRQLNRVAQDQIFFNHNEPLFFDYRGSSAYNPMNSRNFDGFLTKLGVARRVTWTPNWLGPLPLASKLNDMLGFRFLLSTTSAPISDPQWTAIDRTRFFVLYERKTAGFGLVATCFVPEESFNNAASNIARESMVVSAAILRPKDLPTATLPPCTSSANLPENPSSPLLTGELVSEKKVILTYSSTAPALLVLPFLWDEGWSAKINDDSTNLIATAIGLAAVSVPSGDKKQVILSYQTPGLALGTAISLGCLLIICAIALLARHRKIAI